MSNVIPIIPCLEPDNVLEAAKGEYSEVLVIGWDRNGEFRAAHGGKATLVEAYYIAQVFCHKVMSGDYSADSSNG